jgi:hypothetical protein
METELSNRLDAYAQDLILNSKSLELTPLEKRQLSKLKFSKLKDSLDQEILRVGVDNLYEGEFIRNFIAARKLNWEMLDANVFLFGTVGMHVDGLEKYSEDHRSLIIFLDGKGDLGYIKDNGTVAHQTLSKGSVILFNDAKPHDFINKGKTLCRAIVAELKIRELAAE